MLQGVPLGLASGSIPFLLQQRLMYSQIGLFSLATYLRYRGAHLTLVSYPYALKLGWSALVDSVYAPGASHCNASSWQRVIVSAAFGRRKSWIIPMQLIAGLLLWWIGSADLFLRSMSADVY